VLSLFLSLLLLLLLSVRFREEKREGIVRRGEEMKRGGKNCEKRGGGMKRGIVKREEDGVGREREKEREIVLPF
jgi:hypothetical protein